MSDRYQLEMAEARVLYCTWEYTKQKVLTKTRNTWLDKKYGYGAAERIKDYMRMIHKEMGIERDLAQSSSGAQSPDGAVAKDETGAGQGNDARA